MQMWMAFNKKTGKQFCRQPSHGGWKCVWATRGGLKCAIQTEFPSDFYRYNHYKPIRYEFMIVGYETSPFLFVQNENVPLSLPNSLIHYENYTWTRYVKNGEENEA